MLTSYAYASVACRKSGKNAVQQILQSATERNTALGVTGALYSDGDTFFQVIEGEEPVLAQLMSLILRDPRHGEITILDQFDLDARRFGPFAIKHVDGSRDTALREKFNYQQLVSQGDGYVADRVCELAQVR